MMGMVSSPCICRRSCKKLDGLPTSVGKPALEWGWPGDGSVGAGSVVAVFGAAPVTASTTTHRQPCRFAYPILPGMAAPRNSNWILGLNWSRRGAFSLPAEFILIRKGGKLTAEKGLDVLSSMASFR